MKIRLSSLAAFKLEILLEYLEQNWSARIKNKFLDKLKSSLNSVAQKPNAFPKSQSLPDLRKIVITKQTTALYKGRNRFYLCNHNL